MGSFQNPRCHSLQAWDTWGMGWHPQTPSWSSSPPQAQRDKCSLWLRCYEVPLPALSLPPESIKRLQDVIQGWDISATLLHQIFLAPQPPPECARGLERIKMPGSHLGAEIPGALGLLISFQTGSGVGLAIPPCPHTYLVHEFYLPSRFSA